MDMVTRVQIPDDAVRILTSISIDTLGKGMHITILPSAIGK